MNKEKNIGQKILSAIPGALMKIMKPGANMSDILLPLFPDEVQRMVADLLTARCAQLKVEHNCKVVIYTVIGLPTVINNQVVNELRFQAIGITEVEVKINDFRTETITDCITNIIETLSLKQLLEIMNKKPDINSLTIPDKNQE